METKDKIVRKFNDEGNLIYFKDSKGNEIWREYDNKDNLIHSKDSKGYESWYDDRGNCIYSKELIAERLYRISFKKF